MSNKKSLIEALNPVTSTAASKAVESSTKPLNVMVVLFDMSSSMDHLYNSGAVNKFWSDQVTNIKKQAWLYRESQDTLVYVAGFSSALTEFFMDGPYVAEALPFTVQQRYRNGTRLCGSVNTAVQRAATAHPTASILVLTITDGEENASSPEEVARFRTIVSSPGHLLTLAFAGPSSALAQMARWGVSRGNVTTWEGDEKTLTTSLSANTQSAIDTRYGDVSRGVYASTTFLDVTPKAADALEAAPDEKALFVRLAVDKTMPIADFMTAKKGEYNLGSVFYQLTKREKIASHKRILARNKKTGKVIYSSCKTIMGVGDNVTVKPGNFGDYEIFVTSTSMNRKLAEGSYVMALKQAAK